MQIEIILTEPHRTNAANALPIREPFFRGPVFASPSKFDVAHGCVTVYAPGATYYYPLHTVARIKVIA